MIEAFAIIMALIWAAVVLLCLKGLGE